MSRFVTLPPFRPIRVSFFTMFCLVTLFCLQTTADAATLKLQLRSRVPYVKKVPVTTRFDVLANYRSPWMFDYRTVTWDPTETAVVVFEVQPKPCSRQRRMKPTMDRVLKKLQQQGVLVLKSKVQPLGDAIQKQLKQKGIENVIVMGHIREGRFLASPMKNLVVMRDLTNIKCKSKNKKLPHAQKQELAIERLESDRCPTVTSTDVLGEPAFCFKEDKRPHVAILVSDDHYGADVTLPIYAEELRKKHGCRVSVLHGEGGADIHGIEELKTADCLILFVRRLALPKEQLDAIRAYVDSGRPLIGLRTSSHAFDTKGKIPEGCDNWVEFDAEVQGGNYHGHAGNALGSDIAIVPEMKDHPLLQGVQPQKWHCTGSLYLTKPLKEDCMLLMTGTTEKNEPEPILWYRKCGKATVLYCALGHPDDFLTEPFRRLLANMVLWSMKQR